MALSHIYARYRPQNSEAWFHVKSSQADQNRKQPLKIMLKQFFGWSSLKYVYNN